MSSIGYLFLILAFILLVFTFIVSIFSNKINIEKYIQITFLGAIVFLNFAFFYLMVQFLTNNFNYQLVWNYSSKSLPWWLKTPAFWSNPEGATFTWSWIIINLMGFDYLLLKKNTNIETINIPKYLGYCAIILVIFLISSLILNPFRQTNTLDLLLYSEGFGLHNELANPLFVIHPPLVLFGYSTIIVGFIKVFSLKSEFLDNKSNENNSIGWIIASLITLSAGIGIGAYWAYNTSGWGGYWAWDPVETSALIIWILNVVIVHNSKSHKKELRLFFLLTYLSVISAAFTTRSGLWFAVHTWSKASTIIPMIILALIGIGIFISKNQELKKKFTENPNISSKIEPERISTSNIVLLLIAGLCFISLIQSMGVTQPGLYESRIYPMIALSFFIIIKKDLFSFTKNITHWLGSIIVIFFVLIIISIIYPWDALILRISGQSMFIFSGFHKSNFGVGFLFIFIISLTLKIFKSIKKKNMIDIFHISGLVLLGCLLISSSFRLNKNIIIYPEIDQEIETDWFKVTLGEIKFIEQAPVPDYLAADHQYIISFNISSGGKNYQFDLAYTYYRNQNSSDVKIIYQTWQAIYVSIAELIETSNHEIDSVKLFIGFQPLIGQIWVFGALNFLSMIVLPLIMIRRKEKNGVK